MSETPTLSLSAKIEAQMHRILDSLANAEYLGTAENAELQALDTLASILVDLRQLDIGRDLPSGEAYRITNEESSPSATSSAIPHR